MRGRDWGGDSHDLFGRDDGERRLPRNQRAVGNAWHLHRHHQGRFIPWGHFEGSVRERGCKALPPNGPFPGCVATSTPIGGVSLIPLASVTPDPFAWKRASPINLANTTYSIGLGISSTAGLNVAFSGLGSTGPVPSTVSAISFTNAVGVGWPVAVRTVDSRNCAAPTQTFSVAAGETKSFSLNSASTTTLVFSKSTCRAFINLGDCWARTALGLDDIAVFSVGPFWTLFGGRMVSLSTVGDWGKIPVPNSVATIRTQ
jgi:hypothetical protein